MSIEFFGYLLGLVGLLLAIFPPLDGNKTTAFYWIGIAFLVAGCLVALRRVISPNLVRLVSHGRLPLLNVLELEKGEDDDALIERVKSLIQSGGIVVFANLGSSNKFTVIPSSHFDEYDLSWWPGMGSLRTFNSKRLLSDQENDKCYFNLYVKVEALDKIVVRQSRKVNTPPR